MRQIGVGVVAYGVGTEKSGGRKEPLFGLAASLGDLRLAPQDRIPGGEAKPKKSSAKRKPVEDDDDATTSRRRSASRAPAAAAANAGPKRAAVRASTGCSIGARCLACGRLIAAVGMVIYVGAHLPPIQALEIPKRPPTIQITGIDGSVMATRGEMAGANVALKDLPPYLPKAFIAIEDRRFYSHYGVDPWAFCAPR